jgi:hypothetical protein
MPQQQVYRGIYAAAEVYRGIHAASPTHDINGMSQLYRGIHAATRLPQQPTKTASLSAFGWLALGWR